MSAVMVIVEEVRGHQPIEMPLIQNDHVIQQVACSFPPNAQQHRFARDYERPCELVRFPCRVVKKLIAARVLLNKADSSF